MPRVGIVIVTYNSGGYIGPCLDCAARTGAEILVVDNGSTDATVSEAAQRSVRILTNSSNRGFAAAVNQGITHTGAEYLVILNPDALIVAGLEAMMSACDLPRAAGAGGLLLGAGGRPQVGFMVRRFPTVSALILETLVLNRLWPSNPVNRRYRCLDLDYSVRFEAEQPAGAFLMIRRDVWRQLGGFDEKFYPLWFEDVDFCRRAVDAGYHLYYVPEAVAKHTGGHSIPKISVEMRRNYWYGSLLRYTVKHFRPHQTRMVCLAVMAGSAMRMIFESLRDRSFTPAAAYSRVIRLAGRFLLNPVLETK
jgi:N-acetylglucosaminyl-diphospho-decaprenol L-rhamnosyltransferase